MQRIDRFFGVMRGLAAVIACSMAFAVAAIAQSSASPDAAAYPSQPVRVLVGFTAGGGPDVLARAVSAELGRDLGQQFYVENQSGANGTLAIGTVVKADPNGYTLLFATASIAPVPYMYKALRYDILRDLAPVATVGVLDGLLMLVHPSFPAQSVPDFIRYAKANHVVYGSPGVGNALHLAAEMFKVKAGIDMDHVPFRGAGDVAVALLGQTIQTMFVTPPSVLGMVQDGQLRAIALTGSKPFRELPDVPLMKGLVPDYPITSSFGIYFAPANTPPAIIDKLNAAVRKAVREPAVVNVVQRAGYYPDERSPAATAEFFRQEVAAAAEAVTAAKIKPN